MRSFIPFGDPWKLDIAVPYSFLVKDRDLAWTCGQVPLDGASRVLAPDDLLGQARVVCDYIEVILGKNGISPSALGKLVLYYVGREQDDAQRLMAYCQRRFDSRPMLVPVAVPHFYYDGMLLEVDAFASSSGGAMLQCSKGRARVKIIDAGELAWVGLTAHIEDLNECVGLLRSALSDFGVAFEQRLSEHWIAPGGTGDLMAVANALQQAGLISDGGSLVESTDPNAHLVGEITYVRDKSAPIRGTSKDVGDVRIVTRRSGPFAWCSARSRDGDLGLVAQTSRLMRAMAEALHGEGMDFRSVVKSTSHYVGGSSADELYENMMVRNRYYSTPGPASTGLPVSRLADPSSRIGVDFLAIGEPLGHDRERARDQWSNQEESV
ncbi:Rid family hydrolase [Labrys neptuniae]